MKIRTGFVSNSSSSSFILASPLSGDALLEKLEKVFKFNFKSSDKAYPIKKFIFNPGKHIYRMLGDDGCSYSTKEEYLENIYCTEEEAYKSKEYSKMLDLIEKNFIIYKGGFPDHYGDLDQMLCNSEMSYEDSELYIYQKVGY